jgi:PAS domain S-box-containing protein
MAVGAISKLDEARQLQILITGVVDYAIYLLSPDGTIATWNPGGERIKGYTAAEVLGRNFSIFYTPEDVNNREPERALRTAATEGKYEHEGWRVRKDGTRFWASIVLDPIRDGDQLIGFAKVTRDITERRDAAVALQKAQDAFMQSQKAEAISRLTLGLAHDFNNILTVITTTLDRISTCNGDGAKIARSADIAQRAADRGSLLTKQLLAFSRGDLTRAKVQDVNAVIAASEALLRRACDATIDIDFDLEPGLPRVSLDATQFEAAMLNLVINSRDAMADGGHIDVTTRLRTAADGTQSVLVCVRDNGSGMPADVLANAMDPFFTTKAVGKGSGLGLSQVYGTVSNLGGTVAIDSEPGNGTSVTMSFPALGGVRSSQEAAMKILMVDDDKPILEVVSEALADEGYAVVTATNGDEALEKIRNDAGIDVLFSDVVMPGVSGVDLARQAARIRPGLRIMLASGHAEGWIAGLPQDVEFISKPYRLGEIMQVLSRPADPGRDKLEA